MRPVDCIVLIKVLLVLSVTAVASGVLALPIAYDLPLWPAPYMVRYTTTFPLTSWDAYFYIYEPISVEMYFHSCGSQVNCNGFAIPGLSHTFKPYSGQALNDIWTDTYYHTNIREAVIRAYVDAPCEGLTAHLAASNGQYSL